MKASEILRKGADLVDGSRAVAHGDKRINHRNIARLWNAFLVNRPDPDKPLSEVEVALMMNLLKVARTQEGDYNDDDYLDGAAYMAIAGEMAAVDNNVRELEGKQLQMAKAMQNSLRQAAEQSPVAKEKPYHGPLSPEHRARVVRGPYPGSGVSAPMREGEQE